MENAKKRLQVPAFGSWNFCDDIPITKYFESAMEAGLIHSHFFGGDGEELSKVAVSPQQQKHHRKGKKREGRREKVKQCEEWRKTKPVEEDLYEIHPELLCKMPKKKKLLWNLWDGCLGLNCIA